MRKYKDNIIAIILSMLLVIFIWHNFLVTGNNVIFIFIFTACYFMLKNTISKINKRKCITAMVIAILFAIIEIICKSINIDYTLNHIIDKWLIINLLGYFIIAWTIILWIYDIFKNNRLENRETMALYKNISDNKILNKIFNNDTILFVICFVLIVLAWAPYFLRYYPGIVTSDSYSQIEMMIGKLSVSNHHPITHTAIIGICVNIGLALCSNINTGIALYSVVSMITMAIFDTLVLKYLKKKKVPVFIRIIVLLYYMFYPVNAMYSITMWKDILFSGIVPIFVILCMELIFNTEDFFSKKRNIAAYIIVSVFTILLRHNGLYAVILTLPFILITLRKYWKKVLPMFAVIVIMYMMSNVLIFNILKIEKGSIGEMLSIPLQQIARVKKYHKEELNTETIKKIDKFFIVENIEENYNPILSDDVKFKLNLQSFEDNKAEFVGLWLNLLAKYPKDYIESFISNSYGYYYPEARNEVVNRETMDHNMGIEQQPKISGKLVELANSIIDMRDVPIISMLFSIGAGFWLMVICLGYKIYKKEYLYILVYLPVLVLWLTMVASPAFCEFRYAYPIFTTLPLYISMNFVKRKELKDGKNCSTNTML